MVDRPPFDAGSGPPRGDVDGVDDDITLVDVRAASRPGPPPPPGPDAARHVRLFGSHAFFRLWVVQVVSAFGDWLGFLAIIAVAAELGGEDTGAAAAISLVLIPRILPGLFLASAGGVIVDRFDRKRLMVGCDIARAGLILLVPLVDRLLWLVLVSFAIEIATSLWSPAKEAIVPNVTPAPHLTTANSLGLVAAWGTAPVAAVAFAGLATTSDRLAGWAALDWLDGPRLALGLDSLTFVVSAALVATLPIVVRSEAPAGASRGARIVRAEEATRSTGRGRVDLTAGLRDLRTGWRFIRSTPVVRAVLVGFGTGMIGGGMLIPLGESFVTDVVGAGDAGFGLLLFALGLGAAVGVSVISVVQRRLPHQRAFTASLALAGCSLIVAASLESFLVVFILVAGVGLGAGGMYVLGWTILHETVDDELRGRVFASLYVVIRFCVLVAIAVGPLLASGLDLLSDALVDGQVGVLGVGVDVPGVRLALWMAGGVIVWAAMLSAASFRTQPHQETG